MATRIGNGRGAKKKAPRSRAFKSREETVPEGTCPTAHRPPVGLLIEVKNSSELLERSRELFGPSPLRCHADLAEGPIDATRPLPSQYAAQEAAHSRVVHLGPDDGPRA